jgi:hypothetical protein
MARTTTTDEAQNTNKTVAVTCDCPNCGSSETVTDEQTAELFNDDDGYSSRCEDCEFHFRAFGLVDDTDDFGNVTEGDEVEVDYEMMSDGHEFTFHGTVVDVRDGKFDHKYLKIENSDRAITVEKILQIVKTATQTIARNATVTRING